VNLKGFINPEHKEVFGLDVGSAAVKLVHLRKDNGSHTVVAAGLVPIKDVSGTGENPREAGTVQAVRDCVRDSRVQTKWAVCGVSGPEVAVRYFSFPSLADDELQGAILLEASQVCPFSLDDGTVDHQLIETNQDGTAGVLVAVTNALIRHKNRLAKRACLHSTLIDVDGLALLNCFSQCEQTDPGQAAAVVNVGSSFTNLAVMGDNGRPFIRDIAYAGKAITQQVATQNNISFESAQALLNNGAQADSTEADRTKSLEKACDKLIVEIADTLRYYTAQEKSAVIDKVLVCGGFASVQGFVELLDHQLRAKVVLWNPFEKIPCKAGRTCNDLLDKQGPALAVAAGLAMRSI